MTVRAQLKGLSKKSDFFDSPFIAGKMPVTPVSVSRRQLLLPVSLKRLHVRDSRAHRVGQREYRHRPLRTGDIDLFEIRVGGAEEDGVVGLCVGTRPDCCPDECLDLLSSYRDLGKDVIVELGLQTALDHTLKNINRGHDFSSYARTAERIRRRNLKICTHLILGLPGESLEDNIFSLNAVLDAGTDGIKLHPLHIVRGSIMAKQYRAGEIRLLSLDEYTGRACELIARTPARIVFHRISATARSPFLIAPDYCEKKFPVIDSVTGYLSRYGVQGSAIGDPFIPELFFAEK